MRTSRISEETSRVISATIASSRRRSNRIHTSQIYHDRSKLDSDKDILLSDIEDAVPPLKRKRGATKKFTIKKSTVEYGLEERSPVRRIRKPARQIKDPETGEVTIEPPADWEEVYNTVKEMRTTGNARDAAVDTAGCERLALRTVSPRDQRYHTLTALMLSSQTKDTTNAGAMLRLQLELPSHKPGGEPGLNIENIRAVDPEKLNELIWAVGFHNNKTKYIKAAAEILHTQYNDEIPDTIEGLMGLPGVGPKMAYLCLSHAWGIDEGIGVDVHVHRITNLWGWHGKETKGPEETRIALQSWLPRDKWKEINGLLVGLGQKVCLPVGRKCGECEVGLKGLCKSADRGKVMAGRKIKEETVKAETNEDGDGDVPVKKEVKIEDHIV